MRVHAWCVPDASVLCQMPAYDWKATAGKTYTLLFVDLTQPLLGRTVFHYLAYNVPSGAAVTKELNTTLGAWRSPGNPFGTPNKYTNLLFEHDGDLAFNKSAAAEMVGSSAPPFNLTTFRGLLGLDKAKLVSVNWMLVVNSIMSRERLGAASADRCALRRTSRSEPARWSTCRGDCTRCALPSH